MEAWERSIATMVKGSHTIDKQEKIALENELKTDKNGPKIDFVQNGASGKQLNIDGFKFDDKFGKKFHQQDTPTQNEDPYGTSTFANIGFNRPPAEQPRSPPTNYFANNTFGSVQPTTEVQTDPKIGGKGFLDFDTMFNNPGQKSNSNTGFNPFN